MSPYSHQSNSHWGNQQAITTPAAPGAYQFVYHGGSQQSTTTLAAQKTTPDQHQLEGSYQSNTDSAFFYHQLADEQSLDLPRVSDLHSALEITSDGPTSTILPSDTFSVPFDPQLVGYRSIDILVPHEEPPYDHRQSRERKKDSSLSLPSSFSVSANSDFEEPSASSGNNPNLGGSSPNKSGTAFQCPTCNKSFPQRHRRK